MIQRPKALLASLEYWGSPQQLGGHHIARALVGAGWDVAYIAYPVSPLHLAAGLTPQLRARLRQYRSGGVEDLGGRVWAYVPGSLLTPRKEPILRSRWVHEHWQSLSLPRVVSTVRGRGFGAVDLLMIDSAIQGFWLDAIEHRRSVLRVADRLGGFSHVPRPMIEAERAIASAVDLVAYSAASLLPDVRAFAPRQTLYLPNGVDAGRFAGPVPPEPPALAGISRPRAVYVGAMSAWFDFQLVQAAAEALRDVSFVLLGADGLARRRLKPAANLHLLGPVTPNDLPGYLRHADVGLIPFDTASHPGLVNGIHPLKLYEYLASGLPVVATHWEEIDGLGSPAILARTSGDFIDGIRRALSEPFDRERAIQFAERADWSGRVEILLDALALP